MKAVPLLLLALLPLAAAAQQSDDSGRTARVALLEVFTGVQSVNCPLGDKTADALCQSADAITVNIHTGPYATLYATPEGDSIAAWARPAGYPTAAVGRHHFAADSVAIGRSGWAAAVAGVADCSSFVEIAAVAEVNSESRLLTVDVQLLALSTLPQEDLFLNVMLLQNNVIGPQNGGGLYPEMVVGTLYRHNHVLRSLLTPLWGDSLGVVAAGSALTRSYSLTLPQQIGDLAVGNNFADLEVVVFASRADREVLTAARALLVSDRASITSLEVLHNGCSRTFTPCATVANTTRDTISNLLIVCDGDTLSVDRAIPPFSTDTVHLPPHTVVPGAGPVQHCTQTRTARLLSYLDRTTGLVRYAVADPVGVTFADFDIFSVRGPVRLTVDLDAYSAETSLSLLRQAGCEPLLGGTYGSALADRSVTYVIDPADPGLYILDLRDAGADGMCRADRGLHATDADGNEFLTVLGDYGAEALCWLRFTNAGGGRYLDIRHQAEINLSVAPNPVSQWLTATADSPVESLSVFDLAGRRVAASASGRIDLSALPAGLYLLRAVTALGVANTKIVKQ